MPFEKVYTNDALSEDGGSPVTGYRILWNMGGEQEDNFYETATTDSSTFVYTRVGLNAYSGLPFKFKVIADNRQGSS